MKAYYKERAPIYDQVYRYPERQDDLRYLEGYVRRQFAGLDVLEIAAGTGYWTQYIAQKAKSVLATDITQEVLDRLMERKLPATVRTMLIDAYSLENIPPQFNASFSGLWLSHVPKQKLNEFVSDLHHCLRPGARVTFIDNSKVQCNRLPIKDKDEFGNTYQERQLDSGTTYKVLKNFPTREELMELVETVSAEPEYMELDNFWLFTYRTI